MILGGRYSYSRAAFELNDATDGNLNLGTVELDFQALTGSLGILYLLASGWSVSANVGQGFRAPNLGDLAKLGESKGSTFEIPNPDLEPEKLLSSDLSLRYYHSGGYVNLTAYYARLSDVITSADAFYRRQSFVLRNDDSLKVKSKANTGKAFIRGVEGAFEWRFHQRRSIYGNLTIPYGQNTTLNEPLGKMPPLFGILGLRSAAGKFDYSAYVRFAGKQDRLSADDRDDDRIPVGGTPAWHTYNVRLGWQLHPHFRFQGVVENILDRNYREHGSGINGPGRNFIVSLEAVR